MEQYYYYYYYYLFCIWNPAKQPHCMWPQVHICQIRRILTAKVLKEWVLRAVQPRFHTSVSVMSCVPSVLAFDPNISLMQFVVQLHYIQRGRSPRNSKKRITISTGVVYSSICTICKICVLSVYYCYDANLLLTMTERTENTHTCSGSPTFHSVGQQMLWENSPSRLTVSTHVYVSMCVSCVYNYSNEG